MSKNISFLEREDFSKEDYQNGKNLDSSLVASLPRENIWMLAFIANIKQIHLTKLGTAFRPNNGYNQEYNDQLSKWIEDYQYYLGQRLNHSPSSGDLVADLEEDYIPIKFNLFYLLKNPEKMRPINNSNEFIAGLEFPFLLRAEFIGDCRSKYLPLFLKDYIDSVEAA